MKLSDLIRDYRTRMNLSQREFSRKCGLSNTYISFIENERNPKTGRPLIPTLEQYRKIADGMEITVHHLFELLDDDAPVDLRAVLSDDDPHRPPIVIPDSEKFRKVMEYMSPDDYEMVMSAFERTYKKMQEMGVDV